MKVNIFSLCFGSIFAFLLLISCSDRNGFIQEAKSVKTSTSQLYEDKISTTTLPTTVERNLTTTPTISSTPKGTLGEPSPILTWTPQPTLPLDQAQATAQSVYMINGGCNFPCWMGITPGKTCWDQAKSYLSPFADLYYDSKRTNLIYVDVLFKKPKGQDPVSLVGQMTVENDLVTYVLANFSHENFPLWNFLSKYNRPEEIRIFANGNYAGLGDSGDFVIVLFYPKNGIMAAFRGTSNQGKVLHICLESKNLQPEYRLLLWDPNRSISFEKAGQLLGLPVRNNSEIAKDYVLLQDVTNFDVDTFAETYEQKYNQGKCFDVPALVEK